LETRAGAEEIIERLHGRMVRGWNDTGSRISVRFADTTEQRELRVSNKILVVVSFVSDTENRGLNAQPRKEILQRPDSRLPKLHF
jgi:hypothetical protein